MTRYQIHIYSQKHFDEVIIKLFALGYVFSERRIRNIKDIEKYFSSKWYSYIKIHTNVECNMVLHGYEYNTQCSQPREVTIEEFLENKLYHEPNTYA